MLPLTVYKLIATHIGWIYMELNSQFRDPKFSVFTTEQL